MLQVSHIREEKAKVIEGLKKRRIADAENTIERVLELDLRRRQTQQQQDTLLSESNNLAREIGALMKAGKKDEAESIKQRTVEIKRQIAELGPELSQTEDELRQLLYTIPNVPSEKVPLGRGPVDNLLTHDWGTLPSLPEAAFPHCDLIKKYDIIDFDLGTKITGAGFPVYKGKGAKLQRALINFFLDE